MPSNEERPVETGLYYLNSRYYDPEIGRFITADSYGYLNPTDIGGIDLYAYRNNDPVNYFDPSGRLVATAIVLLLIVAGAIVGGTVAGVNAGNNGKQGAELAGEIVIGALIGGAIGGIIGCAAGPGIAGLLSSSGTIGGAALSFAGIGGTVGGGIALSTVGGLALAGAATAAGLLSGVTVMAAQTRRSGGYYGERWPGDPHKPGHVHLKGNGINIRIGRDGNPLPGENELSAQAKKALKNCGMNF